METVGGFLIVCLEALCMAFIALAALFVFGIGFIFFMRFLEVVFEMSEDTKNAAVEWIRKRCLR